MKQATDKKKKQGMNPNNNNSTILESVEVPEVENTLEGIDEVLEKSRADRELRKKLEVAAARRRQAEAEKRAEAERQRIAAENARLRERRSCCGCC